MAYNQNYQQALRARVQQILNNEVSDNSIATPDYVSSFGNGMVGGYCKNYSGRPPIDYGSGMVGGCCPCCMGQGVVGGLFNPQFGGAKRIKDPKKVLAGKEAFKKNPWNQHVENIMKEQGLKLKEALQVAKATYVKKPKPPRKRPPKPKSKYDKSVLKEKMDTKTLNALKVLLENMCD